MTWMSENLHKCTVTYYSQKTSCQTTCIIYSLNIWVRLHMHFCPNAISKSVFSLTTVRTAPNQLCSFPDLPETACDIQFVSDPQRADGGNEGHFKGSEARIRGCLGIKSVIGTSAEAREIGNTWTAVTSNARGTGEGDEKNLPTYLKYQACYSNLPTLWSALLVLEGFLAHKGIV